MALLHRLTRCLVLTFALTVGIAVHSAQAKPDIKTLRTIVTAAPHSQDAKRARLILTDLAAQGSVKAQVELARLWDVGAGGITDPAQAVRYWQMAAAQGHVASRYKLARALIAGEGAAADPVEGLRLLRLGAAGGHLGSIAQLGRALETGVGGKSDVAGAKALYEAANVKGDDWSRYRLALILAKGQGPDRVRAGHLLRDLVGLGYTGADFSLADLLVQDHPTQKARDEALEIWRSQALAGNDRALARLAQQFPNDYASLLQTALARTTPLAITGQMDRATLSALGNFCRSQGIAETCRLGPMRSQVARILGRLLFAGQTDQATLSDWTGPPSKRAPG